MAETKADWEQDIEHELKLVQCTECTHLANWTRTYKMAEDQVDVFVCGGCGHEMHIHHEEVDQVTSE